MAGRPRFLQLPENLANRLVVGGCCQHEATEVLRDEEVGADLLFHGFGCLAAHRLQFLNVEGALARVREVPSLQDDEPVKAVLDDAPQLRLVLLVQLAVLGALNTPFLAFEHCTGQDHQVTVEEGVQGATTRQQEPHRVAVLLQVVLEPCAKALIEAIRLLWEHDNGEPVVPTVGLVHVLELAPRICDPGLAEDDHMEGVGDIFSAAEHIADLSRELPVVLSVGEEPVVARTGHQLRLRVLILSEDQTVAVDVDIEAVLNDC